MYILNTLYQSKYCYLIALAVILTLTKLMGIASRRINIPAVVGALGAGIILGPSFLGIMEETDFIGKVGELGVIMLMFRSGLGTDIKELRERGPTAFMAALMGVILPLAGGTALYYIMDPVGEETTDIMKALFMGVTLTATSVSITVETLREMGKLRGPVGTVILGAAVIDDIIGIIMLTAVTGLSSDKNISFVMVVIKIILFFIFVFITGLMAAVAKKIVEYVYPEKRISVYALAFCLAMSFCAEEFFDVADITGAYFAGIVLCGFGISRYIDSHMDIMSCLLFSPVFFACIGLRTDLKVIFQGPSVISFALLLLAVAVFTKIAGCGISAYLCGFDIKDALSVGAGMVSRGEVALIMAEKGFENGLLDGRLFPAVVFMVIVTTLITPILLNMTLSD